MCMGGGDGSMHPCLHGAEPPLAFFRPRVWAVINEYFGGVWPIVCICQLMYERRYPLSLIELQNFGHSQHLGEAHAPVPIRSFPRTSHEYLTLPFLAARRMYGFNKIQRLLNKIQYLYLRHLRLAGSITFLMRSSVRPSVRSSVHPLPKL